MLMALHQAIGAIDNANVIEIFCKDSSSRYHYNSNLSNHIEPEIFQIMQESIERGLQRKIVELEEEYENL